MNVYFAYGFRKRAFDLQQLESLAKENEPALIGAAAGGLGGALTGGHNHKARNAVLGALLGGAGGLGYQHLMGGEPPMGGSLAGEEAAYDRATGAPSPLGPTRGDPSRPARVDPFAGQSITPPTPPRPHLPGAPMSGPDGGVSSGVGAAV